MKRSIARRLEALEERAGEDEGNFRRIHMYDAEGELIDIHTGEPANEDADAVVFGGIRYEDI
jgi:hypothetical protein